MRKIVLFISTFLSFGAAAEESINLSSNALTTVRMHTTEHSNTNAREMALVKISGLVSTCSSGVFLDATSNKETLSLILSAYISKSSVRIGYEPTKKSPWGDNSYCALTYFDIR